MKNKIETVRAVLECTKTTAQTFGDQKFDQEADDALAALAELESEVATLRDADAFSRKELARGNGVIDDLRAERDQLRAHIAEIEAAQTVALLSSGSDGTPRSTYFPYPHRSAHIAELDAKDGWVIQELIARPAKLEPPK